MHTHTHTHIHTHTQGKALQRIPNLSEEAAAVVWTMIDRVDDESPYAPYWASLPSTFGTALSVIPQLLEGCLQGSALYEEAQQARQVRPHFLGFVCVLRHTSLEIINLVNLGVCCVMRSSRHDR